MSEVPLKREPLRRPPGGAGPGLRLRVQSGGFRFHECLEFRVP